MTRKSFLYLVYNFFLHLKNLSVKADSLPKSIDERIVVLGNGPSLLNILESHIDSLKNLTTLAVNKFVLTKHYEIIQPRYYVFLDPLFFMDLEKMAKIEPLVVKDIDKTYMALVEKTTWDMTVFVPAVFRHHRDLGTELVEKNHHIKIVYYNTQNFKGESAIGYYSKHRGIAGGMNVLHAGISLSLQMGYKKIAIVGADHTWHEKIRFDEEKKELYLDDSHFNRTVRRYFKDIPTTMCDEMFSLYKCFEAYRVIRKWAEQENASIVNCSPYSYIDELPFVNFDQFLNGL